MHVRSLACHGRTGSSPHMGRYPSHAQFGDAGGGDPTKHRDFGNVREFDEHAQAAHR